LEVDFHAACFFGLEVDVAGMCEWAACGVLGLRELTVAPGSGGCRLLPIQPRAVSSAQPSS
jgi:hypothetical protein